MGILEIAGIAFGLAMDAFAVAIGSSVVLRDVSARQCFRLSFHFGLFQLLMPVVGWLAGSALTAWLRGLGHLAAFALLLFIGGKMIYEALRSGREERERKDPTRGLTLVVLSIATSIDALAVGVSFALLDVTIWLPCVVIGIVAAGMTLLGLKIGSRLGTRFGRRAEIAGGIVLVAIGVRILVGALPA